MSPELLNTIMTAVVLPLLVAVSGYVIAYLRKKAAEVSGNIEDKIIRTYVQEANDIVIQAVDTLFQTYVNELKSKGEFDKQAQLEAFEKAKDISLALMSTDAKEVLIQLYGDIDFWIKTKIEQAVKRDKDLERLTL